MENHIKDKLLKVYELVKRGEAGEKDNAKLALDRIFKKYNLDEKSLDSLHLRKYHFKYSTKLELWLIGRIMIHLLNTDTSKAIRDTWGKREVVIELEYLDFVLLSSAYEYFRRHMKLEYNRLVLPLVKRCRTTRTRNATRTYLQEIFFTKYILASGLYKKEEVTKIDTSKMSEKERIDRMNLEKVEGGNYKTQVTTGLYLE